MIDPILFAKELKNASQESNLNQIQLSKHFKISVAKVSRYLALLSLPIELQKQVSNGDVSINKAIGFNSKKRLKTRGELLPANALELLSLLEKHVFLTLNQLANLSGFSYATVQRSISALEKNKKISVHKGMSPFAVRLSYSYSRMIGGGAGRWKSAFAIHQILLRNQIYIDIQAVNKSAGFLDRKTLWKMGLSPSVGEHVLVYVNPTSDKKEFALVIIDDYLMNPTRPIASLKRVHTPDHNYYKNIPMQYSDIVNTVLVYTTKKPQITRFKRAFNKSNISLNFDVRLISEIWGI